MKRRMPLPRRLGDRFTTAEAAVAGVGRSRRDAPDLDHPFYGTRAKNAPETFHDLVDRYRPRLKPGQRFGRRTAMRLWGLPHPTQWRIDEPLDVMAPADAAPVRTAGVTGHRLSARRAETRTLTGVPVVDPVAAVFGCATELTADEAVIVIDALVTTAFNYPGLGPGRPMSSLPEIADRLVLWGRFPGCATIRDALPRARERVESPKETETRLLIVGSGLPEPVVQYDVRYGRVFVARIDLAYPQLKIAIEYEGDGHRVDKEQWRRDIRRQRDLEDRGWIVIRLTEGDLADGGAAFLERVRRAIVIRSR